jgi:alkylhydroperoxidase family enzyme
MAWIETIEPGRARGRLAASYAAAVRRAGRVFQIVRAMSLWPEVLDAAMELYVASMRAPAPLSRAQREMLAVVVSSANRCHY